MSSVITDIIEKKLLQQRLERMKLRISDLRAELIRTKKCPEIVVALEKIINEQVTNKAQVK